MIKLNTSKNLFLYFFKNLDVATFQSKCNTFMEDITHIFVNKYFELFECSKEQQHLNAITKE